jgi:YHS domain-containing protein
VCGPQGSLIGPEHRTNDPERRAVNMKTLIDPVCGMTVDGSSLRVEGYDNVAFCAPGCRTAFLADPARYLAAMADMSVLRPTKAQETPMA